jgi:hypothetical protein
LHVKLPPRGGVGMTAEIAIINRQAIALAADSAITIRRSRVWKYANKLFSLGLRHDIGVMIYNSADFLGIPWEVIIKQFRVGCANKQFGTLAECSQYFLQFLQTMSGANQTHREFDIIGVMLNVLQGLRSDIIFKNKTHMLSEIRRQINETLAVVSAINQIDFPIDEAEFAVRYRGAISDISKGVFKYRLDDTTLDLVTKYIHMVLGREVDS